MPEQTFVEPGLVAPQAEQAAANVGADVDLHELALAVLALMKRELRLERERLGQGRFAPVYS